MQNKNVSAFTEACLDLQFNSATGKKKKKLKWATGLKLNAKGSLGSLAAVTVQKDKGSCFWGRV